MSNVSCTNVKKIRPQKEPWAKLKKELTTSYLNRAVYLCSFWVLSHLIRQGNKLSRSAAAQEYHVKIPIEVGPNKQSPLTSD